MPEEPRRRRPFASALRAAAFAAAALAPLGATAQSKWIGPDGSVNYGDRPPPSASAASASRPASRAAPAPADDASLPYAVRTASARFPVTLYTTPSCRPCDDARAHLTKRGIPFAEKTITTASDAAAFRAEGFAEPNLPALRVGSQRASGFESEGWDRLLDAAAYPRASTLPPGWRPAPATPLAAREAPAQPPLAASADEPPAPEPSRPRAAAPERPASTFRF